MNLTLQFPLPEVVVIHRNPSCHDDLKQLENYILEVRIVLLEYFDISFLFIGIECETTYLSNRG